MYHSSTQAPNTSSFILGTQDVEQGSILFLTDEEETWRSYTRRVGEARHPVSNYKSRQPPNPGMFGHPIVVISRPHSASHMIYFHQITSFAGKTLAERFTGRKCSFRQETFCPVDPAPDHPRKSATHGRYRTLTLENGQQLEKASYVNVREVYQMDWRDAQACRGSETKTRKMWKLDSGSIRQLVRLSEKTSGFRVDVQFKPAPTVSKQALKGPQQSEPALAHNPVKTGQVLIDYESTFTFGWGAPDTPKPCWTSTRRIGNGSKPVPLIDYNDDSGSYKDGESLHCFRGVISYWVERGRRRFDHNV